MAKSYRSVTQAVMALVATAAAACTSTARVATVPVPATAGTAAPAQPQPQSQSQSQSQPRDLHWARASAEHRAIYIETYRAAADRLASLSAGRGQGSWGVILDADETVMDNSEYEVGRVPFGGSFDSHEWAAWVALGRAPALPGAVEFTGRVHQLGGKVVIVTNRDQAECPVTRSNLEHISISADLVLCKTGTDNKNPRFDAVQNGSAASGFPAIAVLEWIGDNIQDFPNTSQAIRSEPDSAFSRFGRTFFALPNAMYGSWQTNPFR